MKQDVPRKRRGLLAPALSTLLAVAVFVVLGSWQVERKSWKEDLIATLTARLSQPPEPLPKDLDTLDAATDEFRRVIFRAAFIKTDSARNQEARVYANGSGLRDDIKGPGYFVFAPARLSDGRIVIINRGFVPSPAHPNGESRPSALPAGPVDIVGVLRWPEKAGLFVPAYDSADDLWFARDTPQMTEIKGWNADANLYVEQELPIPEGGFPAPGRLKVNLPDNHLQYALTWYGLALVTALMFGLFARGRRRNP